jgi:hypothetical protein
MALGPYFTPSAFNKDKYDDTLTKLEDASAREHRTDGLTTSGGRCRTGLVSRVCVAL